MRRMSDICDTLNIKKWWRFRFQDSLWAKFTRAKYCVVAHPVGKVWVSGNSYILKILTQARDKAEDNMRWIIQNGSSSFWCDNWTSFGAIAYCPKQSHSSRTRAHNFINNQEWDIQRLQ